MATNNAINSEGHFDLDGLFAIQQKYLIDLSKSYTGNNATEITIKLNDLQKQVMALSTQYNSADASSRAVLDHQEKMIQIINVH